MVFVPPPGFSLGTPMGEAKEKGPNRKAISVSLPSTQAKPTGRFNSGAGKSKGWRAILLSNGKFQAAMTDYDKCGDMVVVEGSSLGEFDDEKSAEQAISEHIAKINRPASRSKYESQFTRKEEE